jgi:hypothetical protein
MPLPSRRDCAREVRVTAPSSGLVRPSTCNHCNHCNNRSIEQVFATYSYEEALFIRWKHLGDRGSQAGDGRILFLCPTCERGVQFIGTEALFSEMKRDGKAGGGVATAQFAMEVQRKLVEVQKRFDLTNIRQWYSSLSLLHQRSTRKILQRLGLFELIEKLK